MVPRSTTVLALLTGSVLLELAGLLSSLGQWTAVPFGL